MDGAHPFHDQVELIALLKADLLTSGATTVSELKAALMESYRSLTVEPRVIQTVYDPSRCCVTLTLDRWPRVPGDLGRE